eukprot:363378-Chlamydomonas_euryale.AAC.35
MSLTRLNETAPSVSPRIDVKHNFSTACWPKHSCLRACPRSSSQPTASCIRSPSPAAPVGPHRTWESSTGSSCNDIVQESCIIAFGTHPHKQRKNPPCW